MKRNKLFFATLALGCLSCTDLVGSGRREELVEDPTAPATTDYVGAAMGGCAGSRALVSQGDPVLIDIYFGGTHPPTHDEIVAIVAAGGVPLKSWDWNIVRARIAPSRLERVARIARAPVVGFHVRDSTRFAITVFMGYDHRPTAADSTAIAELGGTFLFRFLTIPNAAAVIPNRSIRAISGLPGVVYIESAQGSPLCPL